MSSISLFNQIAETFLDGRLDGIVGNTVSQRFFGNNVETVIGQGVEFDIDWMGYYFQGNTVPDVLTLLSLIGKKPALNMHNGFLPIWSGTRLTFIRTENYGISIVAWPPTKPILHLMQQLAHQKSRKPCPWSLLLILFFGSICSHVL